MTAVRQAAGRHAPTQEARKSLVLATDGSDGAMRALAFAVPLAAAFEAELRLVTVIPSMGLSRKDLREFSRAENVSLGDVLEGTAERILASAKSRASELGAHRLRTEAQTGDPAEMILGLAEREGVIGIVVGKRGWGPLRGMLLGSVSQKLVSLAACPVIVVP